MHNTLLRILILPTLFLLFSCGQTDEEALVESFDDYKQAIKDRDGEKLWDYQDKKSQKYYSELLEHIKYSDRSTVEDLDDLEKGLIFMFRGLVDKIELNSFNEKQFLVKCMELDQNNTETSKMTLDDIKIDGNKASATFLVDGKSGKEDLEEMGLDEIKLYFTKEDGNWKLDINAFNTKSMKPMMDKIVDVLKKSEMGITNFSDMILMGLRVEYPDFDESLIWSPTK